MIDDAIIKVTKELDELKEERVEYTVNNIAYKYEIECLKQEKKQLQNNWNELKNWLIQLQKFKGINQQGFSWGVAQEVLDKMQEMEQENDG